MTASNIVKWSWFFQVSIIVSNVFYFESAFFFDEPILMHVGGQVTTSPAFNIWPAVRDPKPALAQPVKVSSELDSRAVEPAGCSLSVDGCNGCPPVSSVASTHVHVSLNIHFLACLQI